jgi:protein tyrosine phosphatase type 4A
MDRFLAEVKKHNATDVVRVGGASYRTSMLQREGIHVLDLPFEDGTTPSADIISRWCNLLKMRKTAELNSCIVVHCVAGLGRAPVLVAVALIELGMRYEDAVEMIRRKRQGAINSKQLDFLSKYRPKAHLAMKNKNGCTVM